MSSLKRKILAVDMDDVIASGTETVRNIVNERYGLSLQPEDYNVKGEYWGYYERVWQSHGLQLELEELETDMTHDQSHVLILAGASFALTELSKKFKIVIITSRRPEWEAATKVWLHNHFADKVAEVYFAKNPNKGTGERSKGEIAKELGVSWLIDDNVEHCLSAQEHGVEPILFGEYGWHHKAPKGLTNCKDWPAVVDYFSDK